MVCLAVERLQLNTDIDEDDFSIPSDVKASIRCPLKQHFIEGRMSFVSPGSSAVEIAPGIVFILGAWDVTLVHQQEGVLLD